MSKGHKKQHFVPQAYMRPWVDPQSRLNPKCEPYVWMFDKSGSNPRRKSPKNIFTENDIYSFTNSSGERVITLEHGLSQLEDKFTRIRNLKLSKDLEPTAEELIYLCVFVAVAHLRTQHMRNHHRGQLAHMRERMEEVRVAIERMPPKRRQGFSSTHSGSGKGMTIEDITRLEQSVMTSLLMPMVNVEVQGMLSMAFVILTTNDPIGFVTTDSPCTWFDPDAYRRPPLWRNPGLATPTLEITIPISPNQCILICHNGTGWQGYLPIQTSDVDEINRRHIAHCDNSFIARCNQLKPEWFIRNPMPFDAWENTHLSSSE